jgi:integrase
MNSRTIKVVLYPRKDKNGLFPVKIRITENRKSQYISLNFSLEKKYWLKTDRVSVSHPEHRKLNSIIEIELKSIDNIVSNDTNYDNFGKLNVFFDLEKKIQSFPKTKYHSKKKYKTIYYHLLNFWGGENLFYYDLNKDLYEDFRNYLYDNVKPSNGIISKPSNNTINSYLKYLKTFLLEKVDKGIKVKDLDSIRKLFSKGDDRKKIPLTTEEIKVLNDLLPYHPFMRELLFNSLNTFMMTFWSNGVRIGDCLKMTWSSIKDGVITIKTSKTDSWVNIPLNENNCWRLFFYLPDYNLKPYNWEKREWWSWNDDSLFNLQDEFLELNFSNLIELLIEYENIKDDLISDFDYFMKDNNLHLRGGRYSVEFDNFVREKINDEFPYELLENHRNQFTQSLIHHINMISNDDRYKNKYIFPFLSGFEKETDLDVLNNRISSSISLINKSLKEIGKNVGISKNLHNHLSRHSFTSISVSLGTDVYSIKTMLNHKSVKQTESYINSISDVETSNKNFQKINDLLRNK